MSKIINIKYYHCMLVLVKTKLNLITLDINYMDLKLWKTDKQVKISLLVFSLPKLLIKWLHKINKHNKNNIFNNNNFAFCMIIIYKYISPIN